MACPLTSGFDFECDDSVGGIKLGSIKISQWENIDYLYCNGWRGYRFNSSSGYKLLRV
jgi:hypothetical protein